MTAKTNRHPEFGLFSSGLRLGVALTFVPNPEKPVTTGQIASALNHPTPSALKSAVDALVYCGLLEQTPTKLPSPPNPMEFERVDHPLWYGQFLKLLKSLLKRWA